MEDVKNTKRRIADSVYNQLCDDIARILRTDEEVGTTSMVPEVNGDTAQRVRHRVIRKLAEEIELWGAPSW